MHTDPIADMLNRIRNAVKTDKKNVILPYSKEKHNILKVMLDHKLITDFAIEETGKFKELKISLPVYPHSNAQLTMKRMSKPGQRIYIKSKEIRKVCNGLGISILSTPLGIMSGEQAKKNNVGGEFLCEIY